MTDNFEKKVALMGLKLGSSTFSPGRLCRQARWDLASDGRWRASVRSFCRDEPVQLLSRQLGVELPARAVVRAIGGIDASLKQRKGDPVQALDSAMKRIGELTTVELLEARRRPSALGRRSFAMSAATSPGTGLAYGLRRVCAAWGMARSSFYAMTSGQHAEQPPAKRRGPKPAISDQALLVAIEADLEASPSGLWARLRVCREGCPQAGA